MMKAIVKQLQGKSNPMRICKNGGRGRWRPLPIMLGGGIMTKKFTVMDFFSVVGVLSEDIPVIVKSGTNVAVKQRACACWQLTVCRMNWMPRLLK